MCNRSLCVINHTCSGIQLTHDKTIYIYCKTKSNAEVMFSSFLCYSFLQRSSIGNRYSNLGNDLNPLISPRSQQPPVGSATSNHSSSLFMNNTPGNGAGSTGYVCIHTSPN